MFSAERIQRLVPDVLLDIVGELAYWRSCYPYRDFYSVRRPFEAYVPTFKFGYDSYLLHHKERLFELMPKREDRYLQLPAHEQLKWKNAEQVITASWQRMGAGPAI
ncbi:MAG: hypothetical protein ABWY94_09180 [Pseudoxanthomonas sp.]